MGIDSEQQIIKLKRDFLYEKAAEQWMNLEIMIQDTEVIKRKIISLYADYDSDCNCDPLLWFCVGYESANPGGTCNGENCCGCICCGITICLMCNH